MRFMEYFGFASGNSSTGPNFPFMAESVLKDYPVELTGHPALPSVSPYDFVSVDWSLLYHGLMDSYLATFQSPLTRGLGAGVIAAAVIYCAWKVSVVWRDGVNLGMFNEADFEESRTQKCKASERLQSPPPKAVVIYEPKEEVVVCKKSAAVGTGDQPHLQMPATARLDEARCIGALELATVSETFQRQLLDALSKLDDVKYRLKELESEKELLFAEIDLRRKVTQRLQEENSSEREKRQHAELRMEMMEIENSQLKQLRKELALKSGQVERMEKFLKEKDDLQMKLFEDNVVLSRTVAEARAKEFEILQTRVHQLQSELDANKQMCHAGYTPALPTLLGQEGGAAASQAPKINEVPKTSSNIVPNNAPIVLIESYRRRVANTNRRFADKSPKRNRTSSPPKSPKYSRSNTSPELTVRAKVPQQNVRGNGEICNNWSSNKPVTNFHRPTSSTMSAPHGVGVSLDVTSNKNIGVFSQIRALIGGFRESSSESDFASPKTPSLLIGDLDAQKKDANNDNNNLVKNDEYPLSDEQSSVFMSASGGSCASSTERHKNPVLGINNLAGKKPVPVKRLSKCKRDRRRDKDRLSKRKIAAHLAAGQDTVTNIKEISTPCSDSSDKSQKSTVKNFSVVAKTSSKCQVSGRCSADSHESRASTPDSYDDNDGDSGDSWIVILPAAS